MRRNPRERRCVRRLSPRLLGKPGGQIRVATLARKVGRGLAGFARLAGIGTVRDEIVCQVPPVGGCGGEERCEPAGLDGVHRGSMVEEQVDCLGVFAQGEGGMEGLVLLRIAADGVDGGAGIEQGLDGLGGGKGGGQVQRCPAVAGIRLGELRAGREQAIQLGQVAHGGGFKDVEAEAVPGKPLEQKVADEGLAEVDRPAECGDALRIAPGSQRGVSLDLFGDFGGCASLDEFEEGCGHGFKIARSGPQRFGCNRSERVCRDVYLKASGGEAEGRPVLERRPPVAKHPRCLHCG